MEGKYIGMILSICGMLITVISFQIKEKKLLLLFQITGNVLFLLSYIFSSFGIAVILNIIYIFRNIVFMYSGNFSKKKTTVICTLLCASYLIAYSIFVVIYRYTIAEFIWNTLPVCGAVFGTVAVAQHNLNRFRMWKYGDSISWLAFNIHIGIGALGGIIGEIFNIISLTVGIFRFRKH